MIITGRISRKGRRDGSTLANPRVHAYGLMDSRYHLLLQTPRVNLSEIMHHINGADTTYFNVKRALARSIQMYLCQNMRA